MAADYAAMSVVTTFREIIDIPGADNRGDIGQMRYRSLTMGVCIKVRWKVEGIK
jgi:hypothetical protein